MKLQLTLNLWTVFNSTRAVLPAMLEQASGFILGVGSGAAQQGGAKQGPYAASKAAMIAYLKSVRAELQPKGIGVAILHPMSAIDTPGNRKAMPNGKPEKWLDPRALAETMLHLVSRGARGQIFEVMVYPGGG
jgi:short-subunit dehydrogenase